MSCFNSNSISLYIPHTTDYKWSEQLDPNGSFAAEKILCFNLASRIVCISESTRSDLLQYYPHLEPKTIVIPLAGELKPHSKSHCHISRDTKIPSYLLYVGARNSYKNFTRFVIAFSRVLHEFPDLRISLVGSPLSSSSEIDLLEALGIYHLVDLNRTLMTTTYILFIAML